LRGRLGKAEGEKQGKERQTVAFTTSHPGAGIARGSKKIRSMRRTAIVGSSFDGDGGAERKKGVN